jgi:hypothetical protein
MTTIFREFDVTSENGNVTQVCVNPVHVVRIRPLTPHKQMPPQCQLLFVTSDTLVVDGALDDVADMLTDQSLLTDSRVNELYAKKSLLGAKT